MSMQVIGSATAADWSCFWSLAAAERWRISSVEQRLFQGAWRDCAFALRLAGDFAGFVTAVPHQRRGWIGHVLVAPQQRRRGRGRTLFVLALQRLAEQGVEQCWLTASEQGRPLYETFGFTAVDRVERWLRPKCLATREGIATESEPPVEALVRADHLVWAEERTQLLAELARGGCFRAAAEGLLCLQQEGDFQLLGPWYAFDRCLHGQRELLARALVGADPERELVIDVLGSSALQALLRERGFEPISHSLLMVRGEPVQPAQKGLCALASLGSIG
ncbi:MAG: GNAT family N-acetyltransferase [Desulfuromonadaceae bacterium]